MATKDTKTKSVYEIKLPSDKEIVMTRVFNAPRDLVFAAHTTPELVVQWWGTRSSTTVVDKLDVRVGGAWRYVSREADGSEYGFRGEFREMNPPKSFTWTFEFEGMPGHICVETYAFEEHDGKTTLTATSFYNTREERDGMVAGMEGGADETGDRLDELLARLQA